MLDSSQREYLANKTRAVQIIIAALIFGVLAFSLVAWVVARDKAHFDFSLLAIVGVVFAASSLPMAIILPNVIRQNALSANGQRSGESAPDTPSLDTIFMAFQSSTIIRFALIEGAAMLNVIAFMIDGASIALMVAGILVVFMAVMFPRADQIINAIENDLTHR